MYRAGLGRVGLGAWREFGGSSERDSRTNGPLGAMQGGARSRHLVPTVVPMPISNEAREEAGRERGGLAIVDRESRCRVGLGWRLTLGSDSSDFDRSMYGGTS